MVALAERETSRQSAVSGPCKLKTPYPRSVGATSGHRFYNHDISRWPSRDPVGERGGLNVYGFVGNAPLAGVDLLGMAAKCVMTHTGKNYVGSKTFLGGIPLLG